MAPPAPSRSYRPHASAVVSVVSPILVMFFVLAVLFSLLQVLVESMSEPCPVDDPGCGDGRPPFLLYGLVVAVVTGLALFGVRYWWRRWRRRHPFRPAPGWPAPPRSGWVPSAIWQPDPDWPPAPPEWVFWGEP